MKVLGPKFGPVVDYLRGQGQVEKQASEPGQCQCKPTYGSLNKDYTKSSTALLYYQQKNSSTTGEKFMLSLPLIAGLVAVLWCVYDHRKATNQNYLMPGWVMKFFTPTYHDLDVLFSPVQKIFHENKICQKLLYMIATIMILNPKKIYDILQ